MYFRSLLLSLLAVVSLTATAETNWKHISSYRDSSTAAFVDIDSVNTTRIQGRDYISAFFLIVSDREFEIIASGKPIKARSTVKHITVECKSSLMSIGGDFYFKEAKPIEASIPLASTESGPRPVMLLPKSNFIYITLCSQTI